MTRHLCLLLAALPLCTMAQIQEDKLQVQTADAQTWESPIDGIGRIVLGEETFSLNDASEHALRTFRYDEVTKLTFQLSTSGISLPVHFMQNLRVEATDKRLYVHGLDADTPTPVEVFDAAGRRVAYATIADGGHLDIAKLMQGAYIIKAGAQTMKFKVSH